VLGPAIVGAVAGTSYSVVIPARNAAATVPRVLESLAAQEPAPAEVVVVDDGSADGTAVLPRFVVAEWSLGATALHYALRRPALRGESQPQFE